MTNMSPSASANPDQHAGAGAPERIRVLIADDDAPFRRALGAILSSEPDIEIAGDAADGEAAVAQATLCSPQVVLMDVRMPVLGGIEAARVLNEIHPSSKVVMLTVSDEDEDLLASIKAGASGYVLKTSALDEIVDVVRQVFAGNAVLSPSMASKVLSELASMARRSEGLAAQPQLTNQELQILQHVTLGLTTREVGLKLDLQESTVKHHVGNVVQKFHVQARIAAALTELQTQDS